MSVSNSRLPTTPFLARGLQINFRVTFQDLFNSLGDWEFNGENCPAAKVRV